MKGYYKYIDDVANDRIVTCLYIKQAVERFKRLSNREDIYFDEEAVDNCIDFISQIKHYLGKHNGKPFILSAWQEFIVANIIGLKWKQTGLRVCRSTFIMMARKQGKSAFVSAIALYLLIADGEASPEGVFVANSREQARILFDITSNFAKSLDEKGKYIKYYRNSIKFLPTNGNIKICSADSSKLDGLNLQFFVLDEFHEAKDRKLYDVLKSSMGMRTQPLEMIITTAGFNTESPCMDMYKLSLEILSNVKEDDTFFPFIYMLDIDDDWTDSSVWIKSNPNLNVTTTIDFIESEVLKAKNDATAQVGVKTKTLNMWCDSMQVWIPQEVVVKSMKKIDLKDFQGCLCYIGVDLSSVSDFTSLTCMIPYDDKYYFKTWTFLPNDTLQTHTNAELYRKFIDEGTMIATNGNVCDYDYVIQKIQDINSICPIEGVYYDVWNSTSWAIKCTELGFNMIPFSQAIGNFNAPTKELERLIRSNECVIDKSSNILWQFGNVTLKLDHNGNAKPNKDCYSKKIDSTISIITALGGYLKNPIGNDYDLTII